MTNFADRTMWTRDSLDIPRGLNSASIDFIYLDPPFNSNHNYAAPVGHAMDCTALKNTWTLFDLDVAWMALITDVQLDIYKVLDTAELSQGKPMQSYACKMAVRLLEMRRVVENIASIYLHCDPTQKPLALLSASSGQRPTRATSCWTRSAAVPPRTWLLRSWAGAGLFGIDILPKPAELVNMDLQQFLGDLLHHRSLPSAPTYPSARTSTRRCGTGRASLSSRYQLGSKNDRQNGYIIRSISWSWRQQRRK